MSQLDAPYESSEEAQGPYEGDLGCMILSLVIAFFVGVLLYMVFLG